MKFPRLPEFATLLVSLAGGFLVVEAGLRFLENAPFSLHPFLVEEAGLRNGGVSSHPKLGWVQTPHGKRDARPGFYSYTTGNDGLRLHHSTLPTTAPSVLVVGDSFTFGVDVADHETYPAQLEALGHFRVWNAGVSGYGADQAFLRAEELVPRYHPDILLYALISEDIDRLEYSHRWGAEKPYFVVEGGELRLRNVPVAPLPTTKTTHPFRHVLSYSYALHRIFSRYLPGWWVMSDAPDWKMTRVHENKKEVFCAILEGLGKLQKKQKTRVIVVSLPMHLQNPEKPWLDSYSSCLDKAGLLAIDLLPAFQRIHDKEPARWEKFFPPPPLGHWTAQGHGFAAASLEEFLRSLNL